jgi:hypothetical protein
MRETKEEEINDEEDSVKIVDEKSNRSLKWEKEQKEENRRFRT